MQYKHPCPLFGFLSESVCLRARAKTADARRFALSV
jgi:hypothetical protein